MGMSQVAVCGAPKLTPSRGLRKRSPRRDPAEEYRFGTLCLIERDQGPEQWKRIIAAGGQDLLLFLARSRFDGRPSFGQFSPTLLDGDTCLSSAYRRSYEEVDRAPAVEVTQRVSEAARHSSVGKWTPMVICGTLDVLALFLRLFEGHARHYIGYVKDSNHIV